MILSEFKAAIKRRLLRLWATGRPPAPTVVASSQTQMLSDDVVRMSEGLVDGIRNPHIYLESGKPLNLILKTLVGLPAPTLFGLAVAERQGGARNSEPAYWRIFLADRCPQLLPEKLDRVARTLANVAGTAPDRLEMLLCMRADPNIAGQANYYLNRFPHIYSEARAAVQTHLSEALATPGANWSVLFLALNFDALVVARINATFYPAIADRPSPFVYAMA